MNAATAWLRSQGFKVGAVSKDRITVAASGSAAQVERAFGTSLKNYQFRGHAARYATGNLSVRPGLAGVGVGAMGVVQNANTPAMTKARGDDCRTHDRDHQLGQPVPAHARGVHHLAAVRHLLRPEEHHGEAHVRSRLPEHHS